MANISIISACNNNCSYCFQKGYHEQNKIMPLDEIKRIIDWFHPSNRVGFLGGEPTLQKDLPDFLEKIKKLGLKIKLGTNGTRPDLIKSFNENGLVDYFAMDIKNDRKNYAKIIGFDTYNTLKVEQSVKYFLTSNADYEFRTTLIKEYHSEDNIRAIAEWIKGANKYFLQKFRNGENCILQNLNEVPLSTAKEYQNILSPFIKKVSLRSYED